ncbi:heme biosynthesis HemY N-terminal domain-containing protein [Lysobacter solisilvae (ex Woo and Kim 2020)]|uniref:Heme biosynthesis protein HemY n=1 Tax=Agrilutibacter terrestris TaxID=2865112 RepID=A0A7H0G0U8_9GAMM|nr:heme biosynthesis HemY N-terminal domain-containing protein [Lysobacter terrestris]QNP41914.1 heme biosynthesis protein HemY [Lysobacter terrestris]
MNLFRNLLFWIALALLGALVAQLFVQDPGYVLVRYGGTDYSTTLVGAMLAVVASLLVLWLAWKVLSLPFVALRRHRKKQARARLTDGLLAVEHGHWARAEKSLVQAAQSDEVATIAQLAAARAAQQRGDAAQAQRYLEPLAAKQPAAHAIAVAEVALGAGRPADALAALDAPAAQPLPPRGVLLRADTLAAMGRAGDAYGLLGALRQQQVLSADQLAEREARWAEAGLREAADANVLADRWESLPKPLKSDARTVIAYAERAAALRWDDAAAGSIEAALDAKWDEALATAYGRLPVPQDRARLDTRRAHAERWLQARPMSPALLVTLARIALAQGQWPQAEGYLHRALAQGAGSDAWEELGHGFAAIGDEARARRSYVNALRAIRGDSVDELPGRDLRQKIADQAAVEERDAHGVPRLRQ